MASRQDEAPRGCGAIVVLPRGALRRSGLGPSGRSGSGFRVNAL